MSNMVTTTTTTTGKPQPPAPQLDLEFSGLEREEVAVLANTKRVGNRIKEVLLDGGLTVRWAMLIHFTFVHDV